jgi:hypothetical protein
LPATSFEFEALSMCCQTKSNVAFGFVVTDTSAPVPKFGAPATRRASAVLGFEIPESARREWRRNRKSAALVSTHHG